MSIDAKEKTNKNIHLFTTGFTKINAQSFFSQLRRYRVKKLIDIRLNAASQLSGFAKRDDLKFFLKELCDCAYRHIPEFAPTRVLLNAYKKKQMDWAEYEHRFNKLIMERKIETLISPDELDHACLLCSEAKPEYCHRRLAAEYLENKFQNIEMVHL